MNAGLYTWFSWLFWTGVGGIGCVYALLLVRSVPPWLVLITTTQLWWLNEIDKELTTWESSKI